MVISAQILSSYLSRISAFCINSFRIAAQSLYIQVVSYESALLLLMLRILANDHDATLALDYLALLADGFHGRSYFHGAPPKLVPWISPLIAM